MLMLMALMLAGRVLEIEDEKAIVDVAGRVKIARLDFIKDIKPGDYVTIYYGIVLEKVSKEEAEGILKRCSYNSPSKLKPIFKISNLEI